MAWTIDELRTHCAVRGVMLPSLAEVAATALDTPVYAGEVAGVDGFRTWYGLRELHAESGWWPFLAGAREGRTPWDGFGPRPDPSVVERGQRLDPENLLAIRAVFGLEDARDRRSAEAEFGRRVRELTAQLVGTVNLDLVGGMYPSALNEGRSTLCVVQARHGYEVPALLDWAGARAYGLGGSEHCAVLRHFHEQYGAELITLSPTTMDLLIKNRPRDALAVARAALELYAYCPDIVDQGAGGLPALVEDQLLNNTWWLCWT